MNDNSVRTKSSELTSATAAVDSDYRYGYNFDDIGNRKTSSERGINSVYTASQLNQYTAVDDFTPTYDADGNQTLVKTATGIWQVAYNGENRPVRWELVSSNSNTPNSNTQTLLRMSFDRMGRRVTKNDQRFVYNGYLQICNYNSSTSTSHFNYHIWDPTEPVSTRPLAWKRGTSVAYYTHDGNKNVSEVIASNTDVAAHYEYAPFGVVTASRGASASANPWRFSSEYAEDDTATVYYNYRHYEPETGRWMQRDPVVEEGNNRLFLRNDPLLTCDVLGLYSLPDYTIGDWDHEQYDAHEGEMKENRSKYYEKARNSKEPDCSKLGWRYILNCDGPYDESEVRFHLWDEERCMTFKVEKNVTVSYSGSYGSITFEFVKGELYTVRGTLHVYQYIVPRYKLCQCICPLEGPFHGPILPGVRTRVDLEPKEGLVGVWDKDAKILVSGQSWTIGGLGGGVGPISGSYSSSNSIN